MKQIVLFLFILFFQLLTPCKSKGQARTILKNIFKGESNASKKIIQEESELLTQGSKALSESSSKTAITVLEESKGLADGYLHNISKFWDKNEKIIDLGLEIFNKYDGVNKKLGDKQIQYLNEIFASKQFSKLYLALCKKIKKDSLSKNEIGKLLVGHRINGYGIDSNKLYNLYFILSNTFAKEELEKLQVYYKCNPERNKEIKTLAEKRTVSINQTECSDEFHLWDVVKKIIRWSSIFIFIGVAVYHVARFIKKRIA